MDIIQEVTYVLMVVYWLLRIAWGFNSVKSSREDSQGFAFLGRFRLSQLGFTLMVIIEKSRE